MVPIPRRCLRHGIGGCQLWPGLHANASQRARCGGSGPEKRRSEAAAPLGRRDGASGPIPNRRCSRMTAVAGDEIIGHRESERRARLAYPAAHMQREGPAAARIGA
ncbi:hypothetical protein ABZP36_010624 [Zizania latifolia]